jgi:protocatechuate 3,4-dioxygenase beta subunit
MSRTERLLIAGVALLGILAAVAFCAVAWNLFGSAGPTPVAPPIVERPAAATPAGSPAAAAPAGARATKPDASAPEGPRRRRRLERLAREEGEETAPPQGEGIVLGRVVDSASHPVAGAVVELRRGRNFFGDEAEPKEARRYEATTGADGTFRIAAVAAGENYVATARHAGSALSRQRGIGVRGGEETHVPDITLSRGGTVAGIVMDASGAPLRDAKVVADNSLFAGADLWNAKSDSATTDAEGRYRLEHLPAGVVKVFAIARGFAPSGHPDVTVAEDREATDVNFTLNPAASISGTVTDTAGQPIDGVKVYATATDYRDVSRASVVTDAQGKFLLDGLAAATFYVFVDREGYTRPDKRSVKAPAENVDFQLEPNGSISGQVVDRASGTPVTKFVVRYGKARDAQVLGLGLRGEPAGENGQFTVKDLDAGTYVLEVSAEGYAPKRTEPIELKPQGHVDGVVVAVDHGSAIHGVVKRASDRAPVVGAVVTPRRARLENGTLFAEIGGRPARERAAVASDASGSFTVGNIAAGTYILDITHPEFAPGRVEGIEVVEGAVVEAGDVLVYRGGIVAGTVHDKNGAADPSAQVALSGKNFERKARTDASGRFEIRSIPPGDYTISVLLRGGRPDFEGLLLADEGGQRLTVADGQTVTVNL